MPDEFPDPSLVNNIDFYSSAFRIKKLLRRRGWQDVMPMEGKPYGFMPKDLFQKWSKFQSRQRLIAEEGGGKEFERFIAQIMCQWYCNPATFSNKVLDLAPGGDFDVLAEAPGESLFYFETKTSKEGVVKSTTVAGIWNFMVREATLGADMSVFLYDSNQNLRERLIPIFEILYSLAGFVGESIRKSSEIDIKPWLEKMSKLRFERIGKQIGKKSIYYLYWPVVAAGGGDKIKDNVGETISLYYGGIRYVSPFERLTKRPTREAFLGLPNWKKLPAEIRKQVRENDILTWAKKAGEKDGDSQKAV